MLARKTVTTVLCTVLLAGCMHAQGQDNGSDFASFPTTKLMGIGQVATGAALLASASGKNSIKAAVRRNIGAAALGSGITAMTMDATEGLFRNARLSRASGQALGQGIVAASALVPQHDLLGLAANRAVQGVGAAAITENGRGREYANLPKTRQCRAYMQARDSFMDMQMNVGAAQGLERIARAYDACLKSAPNHPLARRLRCGEGKYRLMSFRQKGLYPCGLQETIAAIRATSPSVPLGPALLAARLFAR